MATVTKRGETYKITVSCGYDCNGKQIRRSMTWKPASGMTQRQIEKELNRQLVTFEEKVASGLYLDGSIKFADFADKWFQDYAEKHLKAKTIARYKELMRRIIPAIGHIRLDRLQPQHLLSFYDNLAEPGIRLDASYTPVKDINTRLEQCGFNRANLAKAAGVSESTVSGLCRGRSVSEKVAYAVASSLQEKTNDLFTRNEKEETLSGKTILEHHRLISSVLTTAVQWQIILANPCDRVKPPKVETKEAKYLEDTEAIHLFELLEQEPIKYRVMIELLVYSGFRRGELCGLEWRDIDFKNKLVRVERTSMYLPGKGVFDDTPKTSNSIRTIKLSDHAFQLLLEYKLWQNTQRAKAGDRWTDTGKVFTTWDGKPIHPDTISGWFHGFVSKNDLPPICLHSLRHTNASLLIANHTDITTVSKRLGHANTATTAKIYAHALRRADEIAAETLQDILTLPKKKAN